MFIISFILFSFSFSLSLELDPTSCLSCYSIKEGGFVSFILVLLSMESRLIGFQLEDDDEGMLLVFKGFQSNSYFCFDRAIRSLQLWIIAQFTKYAFILDSMRAVKFSGVERQTSKNLLSNSKTPESGISLRRRSSYNPFCSRNRVRCGFECLKMRIRMAKVACKIWLLMMLRSSF